MKTKTGDFVCEITDSQYQPGSFSDKVHRYIRSSGPDELRLELEKLFDSEDVLFWFDGLVGELSEHSKLIFENLGSAKQGTNELQEYEKVYQMWDKVGYMFMEKYPNYPSYLIRFYQKFLVCITDSQSYDADHFVRRHKGGIYHNLGIALLNNEQPKMAMNYFLLALIEDILNQSNSSSLDFKSTPAYMTLKNFGFFGSEGLIIEKIIHLISKHSNAKNWIWVGRPELIFLEIVTDSRQNMRIEQTLQWDKDLLALLIDQLNFGSDQYRGKILELVATYLFTTTTKGYEVKCNVHTLHSENDLRISTQRDNDSILELLGQYYLVECKNWADPVDSKTLKTFITNVRFARCDTGLLFSKSGITGSNTRDNAWYVVRAEYHRDNVVIIVIDGHDLMSLAQEEINLPNLLKKKYEQIRFDER